MSQLAAKIRQIKVPTTYELHVPITDEKHQEIVETLRARTMEMSFTIHGLPKSRKIGGALADRIAQSVQGNKKGVRSSWSMFTGDHPAVKELNGLLRELEAIRDAWTIVKSANVKKGTGDKVTIESGTRLIWDKDIPEFYALFATKAKQIDRAVEKLEYAMDRITYDADGNGIPSVMDMDRKNAADAWDRSVYPTNLSLVVGVASERNPDGTQAHDEYGEPKYIIQFNEYRVSEKLPELLRERAIARLDQGLSETIETAMAYATTELTNSMVTFLGELSAKTVVYPKVGSEYEHLYEAEVLRVVKGPDPSGVPAGQVKVYLRYKNDDESKISRWFGPMTELRYNLDFNPQTSSTKRRIYPTVIENIISQLRNFKDRKAKMLGTYGDNIVNAFDPLLNTLLLARGSNPWATDDEAAKKLAEALKTSESARSTVVDVITKTVEALAEQVEEAKEVNKRRRTIKPSLIGAIDFGNES